LGRGVERAEEVKGKEGEEKEWEGRRKGRGEGMEFKGSLRHGFLGE